MANMISIASFLNKKQVRYRARRSAAPNLIGKIGLSPTAVVGYGHRGPKWVRNRRTRYLR